MLSRSVTSSTLLRVGRSPVRVIGPLGLAPEGVVRSSAGTLISIKYIKLITNLDYKLQDKPVPSLISSVTQVSILSNPPSCLIDIWCLWILRSMSRRVCSAWTQIWEVFERRDLSDSCMRPKECCRDLCTNTNIND